MPRVVPASYNPRSNRFPSKSEKTLWKKGSRFGNSIVEPTGTTRRCGSNRLCFCTSRKRRPRSWSRLSAPGESPRGVSQTTVLELADRFASPTTCVITTLPVTGTPSARAGGGPISPSMPKYDAQKRTKFLFEHDRIKFKTGDRKSTRLNSSHGYISYAVFCLKKKKNNKYSHHRATSTTKTH